MYDSSDFDMGQYGSKTTHNGFQKSIYERSNELASYTAWRFAEPQAGHRAPYILEIIIVWIIWYYL